MSEIGCKVCRNYNKGICYAPKNEYVPEHWTVSVSAEFSRAHSHMCGKKGRYLRIFDKEEISDGSYERMD